MSNITKNVSLYIVVASADVVENEKGKRVMVEGAKHQITTTNRAANEMVELLAKFDISAEVIKEQRKITL